MLDQERDAPVGAEVLAILETAPWRGNVRELEKVLTEAMILRGVGRLAGEDLRPSGERPWTKRRITPARSRNRRGVPPFVNPRCEAALRIASEQGTVTRRALPRACGISGETARQELAALAHLGYLRRVGDGRSTEYVLR